MDSTAEDIPLLKAKLCGGPNNGKMFCLDPTKGRTSFVLGRNDDCDLYLADKVLSKKHCTFIYLNEA